MFTNNLQERNKHFVAYAIYLQYIVNEDTFKARCYKCELKTPKLYKVCQQSNSVCLKA